MAGFPPCYIGTEKRECCHKTSLTKNMGLKDIHDLDDADRKLLLLRAGCRFTEGNICHHHLQLYLVRYESFQRVCSDPLQKHKKPVKAALRTISMSLREKCATVPLELILGQKICRNCRKAISELLKCGENDDLSDDSTVDDDISALHQSFSEEGNRSDLSECFSSLGMSPIKVHSQPDTTKIRNAKRKLEKAVSTLTGKVAKTLCVPETALEPVGKQKEQNEVQAKAAMFDQMVTNIRDKVLSATSYRAKLQALTLCPPNWSIKKSAEFFSASEYAIRAAKKLAQQHGILSLPAPKRGKDLLHDLLDQVNQFYHDGEFSRLMPGKKDRVSIGRHNYVQRCLILCNLKELYTAFQEKYPEAKISFSKFCSLRPKWCVLAGASGTHSVCVCTIHLNMKLLLSPIGEKYTNLYKFIVCSPENKECMLHRCPNCPRTSEDLRNHIYGFLEDFDDTESIEFSQWVTTDRSELVERKDTIPNYVDLVEAQIKKLTRHSFIAKSQARYLKSRKESLEPSEMLFLGDFAENYKFVVQDEAQSFHWTNLQCTLHPVVVYYRDDDKLCHKSYCFLSDDTKHDVAIVHEVQEQVLQDLKMFLPNLKNIEYFSDGCSGQYKNRNNFLNLCYHRADFNVTAKWSFFATSHGKQPCDGIGGTVKRLAAKASLQRATTQQIMTSIDLLKFCKDNIKTVTFLYADKTSINKKRRFLEKRFQGTYAVPGTRSFHQFIPVGECTVAVKRCSNDHSFVLQHNLHHQPSVVSIDINDFISCLYEGTWWIGIVMEIDKEQNDACIKFMHPHGPARSFHWPEQEDVCWVPMVHILVKISVPSTTTGRQYYLNPRDAIRISAKYGQSY